MLNIEARMLEKIVDFFRGGSKTLVNDSSGKPTDDDVKIACGVLLLEMSGADSDYHAEEAQTIVETMKAQFQITEEDALRLLSIADTLRAGGEESKLEELFTTINTNFSDKQRELVYAMLWKVVVADGRVDKFEAKLATQFRFRLQLNDEQFERAKKLAEDGAV
jgi:uncharacterized tellurite resistance protein B-like protein